MEDAGSRLQDEAGSNGTVAVERMEQCLNSDFRNDSENFAIPAKFRYAQFFAMIVKFRYDSEIHYA